jgi:hypothetical protein
MTGYIKKEADEAGFGETPWQGIFVMRGQSMDISSWRITEHDDGNVTTTSPTISTTTHMAPFWLKAAAKHARDAERLSHVTNRAFQEDLANAKADALNSEMLAAMQAMTCAAIAIDALYAALLIIQPTPTGVQNAWRKNRTKRSRQIFETFRRLFNMGPKSQAELKLFLDQLTEARDTAVHPPSKSKLAQKHARLPVSVDPAFNMFRARNAIVATGLAINLVESTARAETAKSTMTAEKMSSLHELTQPILRAWVRSKAGRVFKAIQLAAATENIP